MLWRRYPTSRCLQASCMYFLTTGRLWYRRRGSVGSVACPEEHARHLRCNMYMEVSWNGGSPVHPPFIDGIFHEVNHPASLGYPIYGNPHNMYITCYSCRSSTCNSWDLRPLKGWPDGHGSCVLPGLCRMKTMRCESSLPLVSLTLQEITRVHNLNIIDCIYIYIYTYYIYNA